MAMDEELRNGQRAAADLKAALATNDLPSVALFEDPNFPGRWRFTSMTTRDMERLAHILTIWNTR
ncbi:hypothetical protein [Streptomyces sp. NPDC001568]|uniref:hypothetical protein n=1 Tax=Streptomyces sp. NPDC001568 TaxID=3364588 RepID=UPI0036B78659